MVGKILQAIWISCLITQLINAERKDYSGYQLLQIFPETKNDVNILRKWLTQYDYIDYWDEPRGIGHPVSVLISPTFLPSFINRLLSTGLRYYVQDSNVQEKLDTFWREIDARPAKYAFNLTSWNTYDDIMTWMDEFAARCQPLGITCQTYIASQSYEGRELKVLKISKVGANRKAYYFDATHHAREWLSTATLLNIMDHLVTAYGTDNIVTQFVDTYDWYFLPIVNPDGYDYTWTVDRYWRKNRSLNPGSPCVGTDLNRNYDYQWGTDGTSQLACSEVYCGANGLSESESKGVADDTIRVANTLLGYVSLHTKGQMWMHPWGTLINHTGSPPEDCEIAVDESDLIDVSNSAADAVQATYSTTWKRGNSCVVIYETSGSSGDYVKGVAGVKYSFTLELRGTDWVVPDTEIRPSFNEVWNGVIAMVEKIAQK